MKLGIGAALEMLRAPNPSSIRSNVRGAASLPFASNRSVSATLFGITQSVSPFLTTLGYGAGGVTTVGGTATTTGVNNTFVGYNAGNAVVAATDVTAFGYQAAKTTTNSGVTAFGSGALTLVNTVGGVSSAFGYHALTAATSATACNAFGWSALAAVTTGGSCNAFGTSAGGAITTGTYNDAFGFQALQSVTTASYNAAFGNAALNLATGSYGAAFGSQALTSVSTGASNCGFGIQAGVTSVAGNAVTTGANNSFFGYQAGPGSSTQLNYAGAIGSGAVVSASNLIVIGSQNTVNGATATVGLATPGGFAIGYTNQTTAVATNTLQFYNAGLVSLKSNIASALQVTDGTNAYLTIDTRTGNSGSSAFTFIPGTAPSFASAAGSSYNNLSASAYTLTLTGGVAVTALNGLQWNIGQPTVTSSSVTTVTTASTWYVTGTPIAGGSVTITNAWAIHSGGAMRLDGNLSLANQATNIVGKSNTAAAIQLTDGTNAYYTLNTQTGTDNVVAHTFAVGTAVTVAGVAGSSYSLSKLNAFTWTTSTTTTITAMNGLMLNIAQPTIAQSGGAVTVTTASSLYVTGSPIQGTSVTITNAWAADIEGATLINSTLTTGTTFTVTDTSLTSGNLGSFSLTGSSAFTGNLVSVSSTGTGLSSTTPTGMKISFSGANTNTAVTATGLLVSVTNTNATSGTNVGISVAASGATTANYAFQSTGNSTAAFYATGAPTGFALFAPSTSFTSGAMYSITAPAATVSATLYGYKADLSGYTSGAGSARSAIGLYYAAPGTATVFVDPSLDVALYVNGGRGGVYFNNAGNADFLATLSGTTKQYRFWDVVTTTLPFIIGATGNTGASNPITSTTHSLYAFQVTIGTGGVNSTGIFFDTSTAISFFKWKATSGAAMEWLDTGNTNAIAMALNTAAVTISATNYFLSVGNISSVSPVTTGSGSTAAWALSSTTLTTGVLQTITSTSTALSSTTATGLSISFSGANVATGVTATGATISVTNTNVTSGTNVALTLTASGATTQNTALNITAGRILSGAAQTWALPSNTAATLVLSDGTNNYYVLNTQTATSGVVAHTFSVGAAVTIASAAGVTYSLMATTAQTLTLTGTTTVTAINGLGTNFAAPTITDASAVTVTTASTVFIGGAVTAGGSVTITNNFALLVNSGSAGFGGAVGVGFITTTAGSGVNIGAGSTNNSIWNASQGAASTTLYIGNSSITVSDRRIKGNIEAFSGSALDILRNAKLYTHDYSKDPTDRNPWGKDSPARGRYVSLMAQDVFQWAPFAVHSQGAHECSACLAGRDCKNHDWRSTPWRIEYDRLVPLAIKGIQELQTLVETDGQRISRLESKIAAYEAKFGKLN